MWLGLVTILLGLIVILWRKCTSKPMNFPNGPARYPLVGSMLDPAFKSPWSGKPNMFWGVMELQKVYGKIIGMYVGNIPTVIFCDYDDIKVVFNMDEASGRPQTAPMHKTREGWKYILELDPVLNKGRTPGVILSNVNINFSYLRILHSKLILRGFIGENRDGTFSVIYAILDLVNLPWKLIFWMKCKDWSNF